MPDDRPSYEHIRANPDRFRIRGTDALGRMWDDEDEPEQLIREDGSPSYEDGDPGWTPPEGSAPLSPSSEPQHEPQEKKARRRHQPAEPVPGRPIIRIVAGNLHSIATEAESAIIKAGYPIFQRGSSLVRPVTQEVPAADGHSTLASGLAEMTAANTMDVLSQVATWSKFDARSGAWVRTNPPKQVADILLSRFGQWRVPPIAGVITTPTMRPDGSILSTAGYDTATCLYHVIDPSVVLHRSVQKPSKHDAAQALILLSELLEDFPFVDDVDRAVALSAMITPVTRGAFSVAPMHLVRAPTPGSGKSYLLDVVSMIATGRICPVIAAASSDEESEKRLVALLLAGFPIISLDNVNGELGGDLLCQAIERPIVRVRKLGGSDIVEIESQTTLLGTGNNMRVRGDMVRRVITADLDAGVERPELRAFKSDPVSTVRADRGRYVSACLAIVRAYMLAGSPGQLPAVASFGGWSDRVRSALVWLGCQDPARSMEKAREDDPELTDLRDVMEGWWSAFGNDHTTVRQVIAFASTPGVETDADTGEVPTYNARATLPAPEFHDALLRVAGVRGAIDPTRLGRWLRAHSGRPVGTRRIERSDGETGGSIRWRVRQ